MLLIITLVVLGFGGVVLGGVVDGGGGGSSAAANGWAEFSAEVVRSQAEVEQGFLVLQSGTSMADVDASADALDAVIDRELGWLDAHPPHPCYQLVWDRWREWLLVMQRLPPLMRLIGTGEAVVAKLTLLDTEQRELVTRADEAADAAELDCR